MNKYFIADTHLGHNNIHIHRPVFESALHNDYYFLMLMQYRIKSKKDYTYFLGDITFKEEYLQFIKDLPGKKILILGNHCSERIPVSTLVNYFDEIHSSLKYKEFILSHVPPHPNGLRNKKSIHGHVHNETIPEQEYINVSVDSEFMRYNIRTIEEIRHEFKKEREFREYTNEERFEFINSDPILKKIYNAALIKSREIS